MKPDAAPQESLLPDEVRQLIGYLASEDERTGGAPTLRTEDELYARQWLARILIDSVARLEHVEELQRRCGGSFRRPRPRREWPEEGRPGGPGPDSSFRHHNLLPEARAEAVASQGVGVLAADELARLLLNPYALWDLADRIDATLPEHWDEALAGLGQELLRQEAEAAEGEHQQAGGWGEEQRPAD